MSDASQKKLSDIEIVREIRKIILEDNIMDEYSETFKEQFCKRTKLSYFKVQRYQDIINDFKGDAIMIKELTEEVEGNEMLKETLEEKKSKILKLKQQLKSLKKLNATLTINHSRLISQLEIDAIAKERSSKIIDNLDNIEKIEKDIELIMKHLNINK